MNTKHMFTPPVNEYSFQPFFSLSDQIQQEHTIQARLALCEKAAELLPGFVSACISQDGELPPLIVCRDYAPEWYMQLGQWENAERYIQLCISCNAYFPDDGSNELQCFQTFRDTACATVKFIAENPGFLQKDIYKQLRGSVDQDCLKHFIRTSQLIEKVPYNKTNRLYVSGSQK